MSWDKLRFIMAFEDGELSDDELIEGFQYLIDSGDAWRLQGFYGRTAQALIEGGYCHPVGACHPTRDTRYVPPASTRHELAEDLAETPIPLGSELPDSIRPADEDMAGGRNTITRRASGDLTSLNVGPVEDERA